MKSNAKPGLLILILLFLIPLTMISQVRLPRLISDGMVLQRDVPVKLWGWAANHEKISVVFHDSVYQTTANDKGEWTVGLSGLKAGGPFTMTVNASNTLIIKDIMIGDVWVCSGQSNMELPVKRVSWKYETEIAKSENPYIRHFAVPQKYDFNTPKNDFESGKWESANLKSVLNFSAVAYFFAAELYERYHVPIGLINASLGGSPAESWVSEDAIKEFAVHYKEAQRFKDPAVISQIEHQDKVRIDAWYRQLRQKDEGYINLVRPWFEPEVDTAGWSFMKVPGYWAGTKLVAVNGVVWFRKEFDVPSSMVGQPALLILGRIVDADSVFVNGVFVGTTSYQYPPRRYDIPLNVLREGRNTIVVRVISNIGNGGFVPDKSYEILSAGQTIDLKGNWHFRLGAVMEPLASQTFIRWKPIGLYNAMLSPLLNYTIKGVAWYQGESNAERPLEYRELFPALIRNWRTKWNQGDFPFLFVQLPNFMETKDQPSESNWALLREAQLRTLSVPRTGMAVAIDIGEWNDIHPLNKKDVGKRLALAAEKVAYGDDAVVSSGPIYQSMKIDGNKIVLAFTSTGSGLKARGGDLKSFAIAGADKRFVWATAKIEGNTVVVWNENISEPMYVRYAWADNPAGANLYNKEGLPASPFRTDQ
ncbi:MAG: sialate O-acetylesterase [Ignavibacteriales bacterium]|nr:sialate O-acetylesterase [Ignavibacteriales bacterium]